MGFEMIHLVPGSSWIYCLALLKFTGLFGQPLLVWTALTVEIIFLSPIFIKVNSLFFQCVYNTVHLGGRSWGP